MNVHVKPADQLELQMITDVDQLEKLWPAWALLENESIQLDTVFQRVFWLRHWCSNQLNAEDSSRLAIITLWSGARLVFLLPLVRKRRMFRRQRLSFLGEPWSQYGNALCHRRFDPVMLFEKCLSEIQIREPNTILDLGQVPESARRLLFSSLSKVQNLEDQAHSLDLGNYFDWQEYTDSFSTKFHKRMRQKRRMLEAGGQIHTSILYPGTDNYRELIDTMMGWKKKRLIGRGIISGTIGSEKFHAFLREMPAAGPQTIASALGHVLNIDNTPVAAQLLLREKSRLYSYFNAHDPAGEKASPGRLHLHYLIHWMFDEGYTRLDFLGNPEEYKRKIGNRCTDISRYRILSGSPQKSLAVPLTSPAKSFAKNSFYALPVALRRRMASIVMKN